MQIELFPYERRVLEELERRFKLERELVVGFACSLNALPRLYGEVVKNHEGEFRAGRIVVMGHINHTHHLLIGGLQALGSGNGIVWSACLRGLMELFGGAVLIAKNPGKAPAFLDRVRPRQLYDAAERAQPGLGRDIKRLHQIVHPSYGAIFAGYKIDEPDSKMAQIRFGLQHPTTEDGREGVIVLANMASLLVEQFEKLVARQDVLTAGKVIMVNFSINRA